VFETLLVRDQRVQALELHLERLRRAVDRLYCAHVPEDLGERVRTIAADLSPPHRLRIDAIPQPTGLELEIAATPVAPVAAPTTPVTLKPVLVPGGIGQYKWRDRRLLDTLDDGHSIPLILDAGEDVLEAGRMNLWLLEGHRIVTPHADERLLPGVTRTLLLELAAKLGLDASTEAITLTRARSADSIFVTSSIRHAATAVLHDDPAPGPDRATIERIRAALDGVGWT
jgi:para-aminobenzoate synthetase/4-amino-4-deoxychorismate lyase